MLGSLKNLVKKYDNWCESMGLTREQSRCCVPIVKEESVKKENVKEEAPTRKQSSDQQRKQEQEKAEQ